MDAKVIQLDEQDIIVSSNIEKEVWMINSLINKKASTPEEKRVLIGKLLMIGIKDYRIQTSLSLLKELYSNKS
jgi:hypothetical protein